MVNILIRHKFPQFIAKSNNFRHELIYTTIFLDIYQDSYSLPARIRLNVSGLMPNKEAM